MARPGKVQLIRKLEQVRVREDGSLRLAVLADTHSAPHPRLMELLAAFGPDRILHAGDIGDLGLLDPLARIGPVLAVRGNIDPRLPRLPDLLVVELGSAEHLLFRILLLHIGLIGTRLRKEVALEARAEAASLVVCGHSHVPFLGKDRGLAVFNPGSAGPRRFSLPVVFGTIEVSGHEVRLGHIDCETGQPWQPPSLGR